MIRIRNEISLIGDFLGTVPAMNHLARQHDGLIVDGLDPTIGSLFGCIARSLAMGGGERIFLDGEEIQDDTGKQHAPFDLHAAFRVSNERDLHMTQAHFAVLGLDVPESPVRPAMIPVVPVHLADFLIAPFSRSLPEVQKWPRERWQALIDAMPQTSFDVLGSLTDPADFVSGPNVRVLHGKAWPVVMSAMLGAKATISLVSGPGHLAYAIGARCVQLTNQTGAWGNNPEATAITTFIPDVTVEEVMAAMEAITPSHRPLYRSDMP